MARVKRDLGDEGQAHEQRFLGSLPITEGRPVRFDIRIFQLVELRSYFKASTPRGSFRKQRLAASLVVGTVRRLSAPQVLVPWSKRHAAELGYRRQTAHGHSRVRGGAHSALAVCGWWSGCAREACEAWCPLRD